MTTLTITLPFSLLVPDNAKSGVMKGRILLTTRYRKAKEEAHLLALAQSRKARLGPFPGPCAMVVTIYPPDKRRRDLTNSAKLVGDILIGVAYDDDSQLDDVRYLRGEIDRENPRAVITVSQIEARP